MAEDEDLWAVVIIGSAALIYCILFYVCDKTYRNNFRDESDHIFGEDDQVDTIGVHWSKAMEQLNQLSIRFERLKSGDRHSGAAANPCDVEIGLVIEPTKNEANIDLLSGGGPIKSINAVVDENVVTTNS